MSKKYLTVYNLSREKDWILKNAFDIIETQEINTVWQLEFSIPMNDQDQQHCQPYWYVRYGDDGQLYRFTEQVKTNADTSTVTYHCEHVIATLSDDIMFQGPYMIGNIGTYTNQVLTFILDKQTVKNWTLGTCEPRRQFEYSWENENLLAALFSVPNCFATPYMWTYDTTSFPWKVNLVEIHEDADPDFYLMAKKNILQSSESSSNLEICTRLYGLGEGEGVNQLTIKSVNNGLPYIQSSPEKIAEYGIVSRIFVDRRYQYPETLKARMETLLHELETPSMKREFDIVDLHDISPDDMYKAEVGRICLLKDDNTKVYITKTVKNWTVPGDMKITIATKATDISTSIADLADRQRIEQVYSQGASQVYSFNFSGNATDQYPLNGYVYFPDDLKYLNEVKLKVKLNPFRSYSKSALSNGGFTKDVSTEESKEQTTTSEDSKEQTTTSEESKEQTTTSEESKEQTTTSEESKEQTTTSEESKEYDIVLENKSTTTTSISKSSTTSEGGGDSGSTSATIGNNTIDISSTSETIWENDDNWVKAMGDSGTEQKTEDGQKNSSWDEIETQSASGTATLAGHVHKIWGLMPHKHKYNPTVYVYKKNFSHKHNIELSGVGSHSHSFTVGTHTHDVDISHTHEISLDHKHDLTIPSHDHKVTIPSHDHKVTIPAHDHKVTIPAHDHKVTIPSHNHKVTIPAHNHKVTIPAHDHSITVDPHSHDIEPGIFTSGNPTQADLLIDGKKKATITAASTEMDITKDLLKNGKVPRGQWIQISIKPTGKAPDNMAYISVFGNVFAFIQSYTGGNF